MSRFARLLAARRAGASESGRRSVVTVLDDAFAEYFRVLLFSIKEHQPRFDVDVVVLHSGSGLSERNRSLVSRLHPVRFVLVDERPYERFFRVTPPRLHPALLKLEVFNLGQYASVLFLDSDMLCLGDIGPLLALDVPFAACPAGEDAARKERLKNSFHRGVGFNTGVMVIGKRYLDGRAYRRLLHGRLRPSPTGDQDILNRFFRFRRVFCLDHRYNYHAQFFWKGDETDVKILHYAGEKPLTHPELPRMRIWLEHRARMLEALGERPGV